MDHSPGISDLVDSASHIAAVNFQDLLRRNDFTPRLYPIRNDRNARKQRTIKVSQLGCSMYRFIWRPVGELLTAETFPVGIKLAGI